MLRSSKVFLSRLQVEGERELAFFPGLAKGGIYPGFDYTSESGSRAAPLSFLPCNAAYGAGMPHASSSKVSSNLVFVNEAVICLVQRLS